jgi:hypothetical protein
VACQGKIGNIIGAPMLSGANVLHMERHNKVFTIMDAAILAT